MDPPFDEAWILDSGVSGPPCARTQFAPRLPVGTRLAAQAGGNAKERHMKQTIVGVFARHAQALEAARALQESGFAPEQVRVTDAHDVDDKGHRADDGADDTVSAHIRSFFAEVFGPTPEHHAAGHEALVRGDGALVRVDLGDEDRPDAARSALLGCGAERVDEHAQR
jgi:hypothetical protein